jgi:ankyrin repeat protein
MEGLKKAIDDDDSEKVKIYLKEVKNINKLWKVNGKFVSNSAWNENQTFEITPLYYAASRGNTKIVELLLENNAEIDTVDNIDGGTALYRSAANGHLDVITLLIENFLINCNLLDLDWIRTVPQGYSCLHLR